MVSIVRKLAVAVTSATLSRLPRVKGFGMLIAAIAHQFRNDPIIVHKSVFGSRMRFRTDDLIGRMMIFSHNYYDPQERRLIRSIVRKGDYVVDIGANIGVYTLLLSRLVGPSGLVDAIEAERRNAAELRYNLELNSVRNVRVYQVGVSDKQETLELLLNTTGNAGGHSFYDQSHIQEPETQTIECRPLSTLVSDRSPKFMKLDIEGFEHRVLNRFFVDRDRSVWPEYLMVEDNPLRREADAVGLCVQNGYSILKTVNLNVFLRLN
jgi:FkbM family methyltransferase